MIRTLRDKLENGLLKIEGAVLNGNKIFRLPQVCNISFRNADENALLISLSKEIALSSGSACTSASPEPSYVLKAMGLDDELAKPSLRFGLGKYTTTEEIDFTIERVGAVVREVREKFENLKI
jgi:cysteine desulfurase